jgi:NTP pyrophosphatase (non-canonical NTP hydrolase)
MAGPFPDSLTLAERERLALLIEECGEAIQVVGKILRHGYESTHPNGGPTNRELLETELGHVHFAVVMLAENGDIRSGRIGAAADSKASSIRAWLHFNRACKKSLIAVSQASNGESNEVCEKTRGR